MTNLFQEYKRYKKRKSRETRRKQTWKEVGVTFPELMPEQRRETIVGAR